MSSPSLSKPATSTAAVGFTAGGAEASWFGSQSVKAAGAAGNELLPAFMSGASAQALDEADLARSIGSVGFIPDVIGDYVIRVWQDVNANGLKDTAEDAAVDTTFTVGSAVASVTASNLTGTSVAGGTNGAIVKLTLKDAAGTLAGLAGNESITIVTPSTANAYKVNGTATSAAAGDDLTLVAANFTDSVAFVNLVNSSEAVITYSITSTGITTPIVASFTVTLFVRTVFSFMV